METSLINCLLPTEILVQIFNYLPKKQDIRNCLLVCKYWYSASSSINDNLCIKLQQKDCERLFDDMAKYPGIGPKIKQLYLRRSLSEVDSPRTFRSIVNLCPNLLKLRFSASNETYDYLRALNNREARLKSIQEIQIQNMKERLPAIRRFHLWVNFRFRDTITSLQIADLENNNVLKEYGGLYNFISNFYNLKSLELQSSSKEHVIDIAALLKSCTSKLEKLKISTSFDGLIILNIDMPREKWLTTTTQHVCLKKLELDVWDISVNTLEYIMLKLKNLENLIIETRFKVNNHENSLYNSADDIGPFFDQLDQYLHSVKKAKTLLLHTSGQHKVEFDTFNGEQHTHDDADSDVSSSDSYAIDYCDNDYYVGGGDYDYYDSP